MPKTVVPSIEPLLGGSTSGVKVTWSGLNDGDIGARVSYPHLPKKTIVIQGDATLLHVRGSGDEQQWFDVHDDTGERPERPGIYVLWQNPPYLRIEAEQAENVTVTLVATH